MRLPRPASYTGIGARLYDVVSGERPVYRGGHLVGIEQLRLHQGDRVLDLGCGTGLTLPVLLEMVAPTGAVVGVDANRAMLDRARARAAQHRWRNVDVVETDAARLGDALSATSTPTLFDAALFDRGASRAPWQLVAQTATAPTHRVVRGGHLHIAAGTRP